MSAGTDHEGEWIVVFFQLHCCVRLLFSRMAAVSSRRYTRSLLSVAADSLSAALASLYRQYSVVSEMHQFTESYFSTVGIRGINKGHLA